MLTCVGRRGENDSTATRVDHQTIASASGILSIRVKASCDISSPKYWTASDDAAAQDAALSSAHTLRGTDNVVRQSSRRDSAVASPNLKATTLDGSTTHSATATTTLATSATLRLLAQTPIRHADPLTWLPRVKKSNTPPVSVSQDSRLLMAMRHPDSEYPQARTPSVAASPPPISLSSSRRTARVRAPVNYSDANVFEIHRSDEDESDNIIVRPRKKRSHDLITTPRIATPPPLAAQSYIAEYQAAKDKRWYRLDGADDIDVGDVKVSEMEATAKIELPDWAIARRLVPKPAEVVVDDGWRNLRRRR